MSNTALLKPKGEAAIAGFKVRHLGDAPYKLSIDGEHVECFGGRVSHKDHMFLVETLGPQQRRISVQAPLKKTYTSKPR